MFEKSKTISLLNKERLQKYTPYFKQIEVPAKTILLEEGQVSKRVYWIEKGCIRVWFNNDGKDITYQFFFENSTVASIESFRKNIPSAGNMEALEPCTLWYADKEDIEFIIDEICEEPELRKLFIDKIFQRTFDYMKYFFSAIKDPPQQRYLDLLKENPQLIQRVPQHYIASYLGITTVHLSRIKSKLAKSKN
ncbi:MAG: Crp/Fnr family transcriptional regulator [Bacteroidota bacterium]